MPQQRYPWHSLEFMNETFIDDTDGKLQVARNYPDRSPQLLLMHGVLRNWRSFYTILPELHADYSIAALDFRGHGASTACPPYFVMDYVQDAIRALRYVDQPCVVYGHSLGAMVALASASAEPTKVKSLVLEDPPFSTMGERITYLPMLRYFQGVEHCVGVERPANLEAMFQAFSNIVVDVQSDGKPIFVKDQRDETSRRFSAECLIRVDPRVLEPITSGNWLNGYDLNQLLKQIRCPVVLFQADSRLGGMLTDADANLIANKLGDQCLRQFFPNIGHSIHWVQPENVIANLQRVLAD